MCGACGTHGGEGFPGKLDRYRHFRLPRCIWDYNIRMDLNEVG
jgi:hypothetical protein